eukprot:1419479-Rhodomonas_salina.1
MSAYRMQQTQMVFAAHTCFSHASLDTSLDLGEEDAGFPRGERKNGLGGLHSLVRSPLAVDPIIIVVTNIIDKVNNIIDKALSAALAVDLSSLSLTLPLSSASSKRTGIVRRLLPTEHH